MGCFTKTQLTLVVTVSLSFACMTSAVAGSKTCGIECAFGAVSSLGIEPRIPFRKLIDKEYVSQPQGSTANDVLHAIEDLGGQGIHVKGLGCASLRYCDAPMILHVASDGQLDAANHWVLALGATGGDVRVVDGEGEVQLWPMERILVRWDGEAIIVNAFPERQRSILNWIEYFYSLAVVAAVFIVGMATKGLAGASSAWRRALGIYAGVIAAVWLLNACFGAATLPSQASPASKYAFSALGDLDTEEIEYPALAKIIKEGNSTLIDCRYEQTSARGTLPGALRVPVDLRTSSLSRSVKLLHREQLIVLYCQSRRCAFSDYMAVRLAGLGFRKIVIYRGGYEDWRQQHVK